MADSFDWSVVFRTPFGWLTVATVAGVLAGIVSTLAANWRKVRIAEQSAALKQSMIERGMSAEDIERVLRAGRSSKSECSE